MRIMTHETPQVSDRAQVFVSYGRGDAKRVLEIARLLEQEGVTIWRDGDCILGGQYYGEEIAHAIAHSQVVMVMCSPHSLQSDNVHREVLLTWDYYHRRYIPVWLSPVMEIPVRFRYCLAGCQWIDTHSQPPERWLPQLLKALKAVGVETKDGAPRSGEAIPTPAPIRTQATAPGDTPRETEQRGPRFKPGDRPVRGADWELERLLGKGGFGEVWKAKHPELPGLPPVALKFCLQLDDHSKGLLRHEADMVLRAQQQFRSSASGIVPLIHAYLNNDPPCLEYPYIEGGTLLRLIDEFRQSAGALKPAQAQQIVHRVAQIVSAAHRATPRLVHRDLKPSNILVERRGDGKMVLRVTDFGIGGLAAQPVLERSRSTSLMENMSSVLTGSYSPLYASPQQIRGEKPDPRDDVYALGVIWYQLVTGDLASPAPTGRRWADGLRHKGMSDQALDLLSSCFESNPADRPSDAGNLAELLAALANRAAAKTSSSTTELPLAEPQKGDAPSEPPAHPSKPIREGDPPRLTAEAALRPGPRDRIGEPALKPIRSSAAADRPPTSTAQPKPALIRAEASQRSAWRLKIAAGLLGSAALLGIVLYIATDNGTVKITGSDSQMKIAIDGNDFTIENLGKPITFRTGMHKLMVKRDGIEFKSDSFQVKRGEETMLDVTYIPPPEHQPDRDNPAPSKPAENPPAHVENKTPVSVPPERPAKPVPANELTTRTGQIKLRLIPAGEFMMGSPDSQGVDDERPQHKVRITRPFYLGAYEVTQEQYQAVTGQDPSWFSSTGGGKDRVAGLSTDHHPVENVSWLDAVVFCNLLSEKEGLKPFYAIDGETVQVVDWNATGYRLPTEAE
jgi:serine/threonine protein kinase